MIVSVVAPAGITLARYGRLQFNVDADHRSLAVPRYVAAALLAVGFTCAEDLSAVDTGAELAAASPAEAALMARAWGQPGMTPTRYREKHGVLPDMCALAKQVFAANGQPKVSVD